MGQTAFVEKGKPPLCAETIEQQAWFDAWLHRLKAGIAAIATAKSFQQFGREEEKE
jgi:hypothetical protein